ncbi:hypothetical protein DCO57_04870 [Labrenzia sp. 011]|nr:hypothetical protein DCO57_04870 [Labrenzia sp. 011]
MENRLSLVRATHLNSRISVMRDIGTPVDRDLNLMEPGRLDDVDARRWLRCAKVGFVSILFGGVDVRSSYNWFGFGEIGIPSSWGRPVRRSCFPQALAA